MRILHVIPAVAPRYGGPSVVALRACRALIEAGHDVRLATTDADGTGRLPLPAGQAADLDGVPVQAFRRLSGEAWKWSPALARWLHAQAERFDVVDVHAVFSHSSLAAGRAARAHGVPYVVRPHGALDPWSLGQKAGRKRLMLALGGRRLLSGAARMQYTTRREAELAGRALPWLPAGDVIPLGVDAAWFAAEAEPADPPYVLVLSRLDPKKGLDLLIDAWAAATASLTEPWTLVVAGDGPRQAVRALRGRAARSAAADRMQFTGWVGGDRRRDLVRRASLVASPSFQENFGLSVAEAMAAGVPVLVSPGVNLADDISAAGAGWVVAREPAAFDTVLRQILTDRRERDRRGRAARVLADRFRWDEHARALVAQYALVMAEAVRRG